MKKILTVLFTILVTTIYAEAKNETANTPYKIVKCNDKTNVCIVRFKHFNYGLTDKNLNTILPTEYSYISFCKDNDTNIKIVKKDSNGIPREGRANKYGKIIIEPVYLQISPSGLNNKYKIQTDFGFDTSGLADIQTGHIDVEPQYSSFMKQKNGQILVWKNDKAGILDKNYKLIIPEKYDSLQLMNGHKYYRAELESLSDNMYGIIDLSGKIILPFEYTWIDPAGITNKNGSPKFDYTIVKDSASHTFNSLTGEIK